MKSIFRTEDDYNSTTLSFEPEQLGRDCAPWRTFDIAYVKVDKFNAAIMQKQFVEIPPLEDGGLVEFLEEKGKVRTSLPPEFFNYELFELAHGSDERVMNIIQEYGLLTSPKPLVKTVRDRLTALKRHEFLEMPKLSYSIEGDCDEVLGEGARLQQQLEGAIQAFRNDLFTDEGNMSNFTRRDDHGEMSSIDYFEAAPPTAIVGNVATLLEIRSTAKMLLEITDLFKLIGQGKTSAEILDKFEKESPPGFALGPSFSLSRLIGESLTYLDMCLGENRNLLKIRAIRDEIDYSVNEWLSCEGYDTVREGSLTEAVAVQIFNASISGAPWSICRKCSRTFQVPRSRARFGQRTSKTIYCSNQCRNAASQAAYRARKKAQSATDKKDPS